MSASLSLLQITGYTDEGFDTPFSGSPYKVMINPENIKWTRAVEYNSQQAPNTLTPSQKYKSTPADKLSFDIVIDTTGIVDSTRVDMATEISSLEDIIFTYNGDIHRPNFVKVQWGEDIVFDGVLESFDTSFTLFKPDGTPLRAKVSLAFSEYIDPSTAENEASKSSPDMTHLVDVVDGDTMPNLCHRIWDDSTLFVQAAKFNKLNKFRNLKGGQRVMFPPITNTSNG